MDVASKGTFCESKPLRGDRGPLDGSSVFGTLSVLAELVEWFESRQVYQTTLTNDLVWVNNRSGLSTAADPN